MRRLTSGGSSQGSSSGRSGGPSLAACRTWPSSSRLDPLAVGWPLASGTSP